METEFKFHIPHEHLKAVEAALRGADAVRTRLRASYFDTADGTLAARGVVLRLRQEGRRWVQTAKATGDGPLRRLEHNVELGAARAAAAPHFVAAGNVVVSSGTPSRSASACARSTETPRGRPVARSVDARIGLPRLIEARRRPVGASSATSPGVKKVLIGTFSRKSGRIRRPSCHVSPLNLRARAGS